MDRRDHFAAAALTGLITSTQTEGQTWGLIALDAVACADALIARLDADRPRTPVDVMADEVMVELENILRLADAMRVAVQPFATGEVFPNTTFDAGRGVPSSVRTRLFQAQTKALFAIANYEAYREGLRSSSPA